MLKELEDYNWFPAALRRWQMEFIGTIAVWTKLYSPLFAVLRAQLAKKKITCWQDVCSGSGIPAVHIHQQLNQGVPLLLTDKYPDSSYINQRQINYSLDQTDILLLRPNPQTVYTMFNALHHFTDKEQNLIIQKMAAHKAPFLIAEILEPGLLNCFKIFFTTVFIQLFTAPFIKPFSVARLFFTYIIPVNLFTITYDGIISVVKSKTVVQYQQQLQHISAEGYQLSVHKISNWKGNIIYIKGTPVTA